MEEYWGEYSMEEYWGEYSMEDYSLRFNRVLKLLWCQVTHSYIINQL